MAVAKDLSGQQFSYLTVIERTDDYVTPRGAKSVRYLCQCVCGNLTKVVASKLRNGHTRSCGQCGIFNTFQDFTGQRFDKLLVLRQDGWYIFPNGQRDARWLCECDCGNIISIRGNSLRRKGNHSCICYRSESKISDSEMVSKRFGSLTVLARSEDAISSTGTKIHCWLCECDCGYQFVAKGVRLRSGYTVSCTFCSGVSKSEMVVRSYLDEFGFEYSAHKTFPDLIGTGGGPLSFDFAIDTEVGSVLVECHGLQHYAPIEFFGGQAGFEKQQQHDCMKRDYAMRQGMPLLVINCSRFDEREIRKALAEFLG